MKTETAKIENFTNIEAIKDKLKKEVTSLRDELKNYKANLLEEQERIDEEKMQRLELEEQISEMRKRIKTEATEKAKENGRPNCIYRSKQISMWLLMLNAEWTFY